MTAPPPNVVAAYNPETCECVLAEGYKCAIRDAIPSTKVYPPLEAFWHELADIVSKFCIMEKCRANRRPLAAEIKYWGKIAELAVTDDGQAEAKRKIATYQMLAADFKGKHNRNHEALYRWVLEDLWCGGLGQKLGVSSAGGKVPGPLIRFFAACVNPLLPKPLTANGIVAIVDRAKARRERLQDWRRRGRPT